jgi:hypothetical protein
MDGMRAFWSETVGGMSLDYGGAAVLVAAEKMHISPLWVWIASPSSKRLLTKMSERNTKMMAEGRPNP